MLFNLVVVACLILAVNGEYKSELVLQDETLVGSHVLTPQPLFKGQTLPAELDYRKLGLTTTDLNQHLPVYCGSCWAHSALSSIADRIKIMTKGLSRDIIPSVQALINCGSAGSCNGGDSNSANAWIFKNGGIPDVTCQPYVAKNMQCSDTAWCYNCDPDAGCYPQKTFGLIKIAEYGSVKGDDNIRSELLARGPVSIYLNANCILDYAGGINMYDTCPPGQLNHAVQLSGWGSENGTDYWIIRNSWGRYWGEDGWARIVRGGKFSPGTAYWAVPVLPEA